MNLHIRRTCRTKGRVWILCWWWCSLWDLVNLLDDDIDFACTSSNFSRDQPGQTPGWKYTGARLYTSRWPSAHRDTETSSRTSDCTRAPRKYMVRNDMELFYNTTSWRVCGSLELSIVVTMKLVAVLVCYIVVTGCEVNLATADGFVCMIGCLVVPHEVGNSRQNKIRTGTLDAASIS
jgi:hypothetical protein